MTRRNNVEIEYLQDLYARDVIDLERFGWLVAEALAREGRESKPREHVVMDIQIREKIEEYKTLYKNATR